MAHFLCFLSSIEIPLFSVQISHMFIHVRVVFKRSLAIQTCIKCLSSMSSHVFLFGNRKKINRNRIKGRNLSKTFENIANLTLSFFGRANDLSQSVHGCFGSECDIAICDLRARILYLILSQYGHFSGFDISCNS